MLAVERLIRLLGEEKGVLVVGSSTDPRAGLDFLSREPVDCVFLDIQMPGMNGFDLLSRLPKQPLVIFTTAYDQYALKAFEVNSIDFLLKPVDPKQLQRAPGKLERLRPGAKPDMDATARTLFLSVEACGDTASAVSRLSGAHSFASCRSSTFD